MGTYTPICTALAVSGSFSSFNRLGSFREKLKNKYKNIFKNKIKKKPRKINSLTPFQLTKLKLNLYIGLEP